MKHTALTLTALAAVLALTACTSQPADSDSAVSTATAAADPAAETSPEAETQAPESEPETPAETIETDAAPAESIADDAAPAESIAEDAAPENADQAASSDDEESLKAGTIDLLNHYSEIDCISACCLDYDFDDAYQPDGTEYMYQHVTDSRFHSTDDLKAYVAKYLTGAARDDYSADMFDGQYPIYLDRDGKLYMLMGGRGSGFDFNEDTLSITDRTDDSYTATVTYENPGNILVTATVTCERVDGSYRISSFRTNE